jgi:uncharacterized membrane protein
MQIWTFLHILSMFSAVTVIVGAELLALYAIRRRDIGMVRAYFRLGKLADQVGMTLFLIGIAFGLIAAVTIGWALLTGWLVIAYVLVVLTIVIGFSSVPYLGRLEAALPEHDDDPPSPELDALLRSPTLLLTSGAAIFLTALIIADMVFKPSL